MMKAKVFVKINLFLILLIVVSFISSAQMKQKKYPKNLISVQDFLDSSHHWYDINDEKKNIYPLDSKPKYEESDIFAIADNILLYQKENGGWPKNYDMRAVLNTEQKEKLMLAKSANEEATIDNGATHSQIRYLASAYMHTNKNEYKEACLKGLDYLLSAQYPNGGWPQFYPDTSGYRKHITFNDGAMIGCMKVLADIVNDKKEYKFVDDARRIKITESYNKGIDCILNCQINEGGEISVWCQQHNHITYKPEKARAFELAAICNGESSEITSFLMSIENPSERVKNSVINAVEWFEKSKIKGIKIEKIKSQKESFQYHTADFDRVVVKDKNAPAIWPRFNELKTHKPLFCNRDSQPVYSLAEVSKERRTGYGWYTYEPQKILNKFKSWKKKWLTGC